MINFIHSNKFTYHFAAKYSLDHILNKATENDLNKKDENGRTPIHYAALKGNLSSLKIILSLGGKVDKCDLYGNSPLHYAVLSKDLKCISFLVNFEPRLLWMMDINNMTAKEHAISLDYDDVVDKLDELNNKNLNDINYKKFYDLKIKEIKKAQKRRKKYFSMMKNASKQQLSDYRKENSFRFEFGSRTYMAFDKIILNDNVTLSNSVGSSTSLSSSSSTFSSFENIKDLTHSKKKLFKLFEKSANKINIIS